jgi:hypothetical protein
MEAAFMVKSGKKRKAQRKNAKTPRTPAKRAAIELDFPARRIYPSIGIARVGDCEDSFMIGPEAPGVGPFRGADHGLKPQTARFRIYKVDIDANENETVIEEIIPGGNVKIEWSVSLANRKTAGFSDSCQADVPKS